jgi:CTP:molybdopterin cytidylyltransferase MocA
MTPAGPLIGVVLAAGGSTRMGQPKALLQLSGRSLLEAHCTALLYRCERVIVVSGAYEFPLLRPPITVLQNHSWATTGSAESLALALEGLPPSAEVVVTPVDVPPVPNLVLDRLVESGAPAVLTHRGAWGHPVLIQAGPTREALGSGHLRQALQRLGATLVETDWADTTLNLNTPEQWAAWRDTC